jgi:hypothetical protein
MCQELGPRTWEDKNDRGPKKTRYARRREKGWRFGIGQSERVFVARPNGFFYKFRQEEYVKHSTFKARPSQLTPSIVVYAIFLRAVLLT